MSARASISAPVKTFGPVDERSLAQLERCAAEAERAVLCADHHPGYSQPIGGAVAYEHHISPSGVGYDIACLAAGTPVTTSDGYHVPIEQVQPRHRVACWDGTAVRDVEPNLGAHGRGFRPTLHVALANGRRILLTDDHELRTPRGWIPAAALTPGDEVACVPFVGLPFEPARRDDPRLPALLRLLGFVSGDGHLTRNGKRVSLFAFDDADASALCADLRRLGFEPRIAQRRRRPDYEEERHIYVDSVHLHALLAAIAPVGKKSWAEDPMPWLFDEAAWLRAQFMSGFASAEMVTPYLLQNRTCSLALKQVGTTTSVRFVARLLTSLGFQVSITRSGRPSRSGRQAHYLSIAGRESEQVRFLEQIGFCYSRRKRRAAATVASVAWQRAAALSEREVARAEAGRLRAGEVRRPRGDHYHPAVADEVAWVPVVGVEQGDRLPVYDVVTGDPAESFLASGIVVHNCGNKAVRTPLRVQDVPVAAVMDEIVRRVDFGVGRRSGEPVEAPVLDAIAAARGNPVRRLERLARDQLGTVGGGNHYVDLFADEDGVLWVGVHFGSRGFGHRTASGFLALARGRGFDERVSEGGMDAPPVLLDVRTELGQSYLEAMELAGRYAYAGRDAVVDRVLEILGTRATVSVHNHHNFAWRERHFGRDLWVVRKGCTPAFPGQRGFVGGSMGDVSVILAGRDAPEAREALFSTVHGAGRVMSRTQAAGKMRRRTRWACSHPGCPTLVATARERCPEHPDARMTRTRVSERVSPGLIDWGATRAELAARGIELRGGGADEAPGVYKRLPEVLAAHGDTIEVLQTLRPLGVAMAGADVFDPYRD
jgi:tRNA-splicing ligase RtcB